MRTLAEHRSMRAVLILLLGALAGSIGLAQAAAPSGESGAVTFNYLAPSAEAVYLAGDFNGWNAADLMLTPGDGGLWTTTVELAEGRYEYKFVVDGQWMEDPDNPEKVTDPFGGSNSLVTVTGSGAVLSKTAPAAAPSAKQPAAKLPAGELSLGRPRTAEGGILFTYGDPNSSSVFLAGSFNEWNAEAIPLAQDESGLWSVVHSLPAGSHEYKFVVDGAWFADPENPDTQADPYGGANSLVTVDDSGQLIAAAAPAAGSTAEPDQFRSNTSLNARVNMNGRYLTRFEVARGVYGDPRYRMQRPSQSVDLNFDTQVSDIAHTMFRMRLDSGQNIIQNNIAAFMDEANLLIEPDNFTLNAYWNQEIFTGEDPMLMGGNLDLPGTIGHDHLDFGKGSAGFLFEANPAGVRFRAFFANMYNQDYFNDPDLFDNTGEDRVGVRMSRQWGPVEIGVPVYVERSVINYDFNEFISSTPTGLPTLDDHLAETNDPSDYFTIEDHRYNTGLDLSYRIRDGLKLSGQGIHIDEFQGLIWGNKAGQAESPEAIYVPIHEREQIRFRTQIDWQPRETMNLMAQHTWGRMWGADPSQRWMAWSFLGQADAENRVYIGQEDALPELDSRFTELEFDWHSGTRDLKVWAWRRDNEYNFGAVDLAGPNPDSGLTDFNEEIMYLAVLFGGGLASSESGRGELEFGVHLTDTDLGRSETDYYEMIFRYDLDLTRRVGFISDIRYVNYPRGTDGDEGGFLVSDNDYVAPFVGFRYRPIRTMDLVLAYGVDPMDFTIDYDGRQIGRWWYRNQFLFDNPGAGTQEAESHLADARVITLRAQVRF
jgi:Glycogen recognition site of AMP-activated protein kinase